MVVKTGGRGPGHTARTPPGSRPAALMLSGTSIPETSTAGTLIGVLSVVGTTGTPVYALDNNAGGKAAISGANINRGATALDYATATFFDITVSVTGVTPVISPTTFRIAVTTSSVIDPALFGMPTAPTAGVQAGHTLTAYAGPSTISANNVTVTDKTITGTLNITGANCTIQNCQFTSGGFFAIDASATATNLLIEYCDVIGDATTAATAISAAGTIRNCDISGYENGIVVQAGASVITGNYIHGLNNDGGDPHVDGIAVQGNQTSVLIEGNTVQAWDTSCIFIKNDFGPISNVTVRYNLLMPDPVAPGGRALGYNVVVDARGGGGAITNTLIEHNYIASGVFGDITIESTSPTLRNNTSWRPGIDPIPYPNLSDTTPAAFSFTDATGVALGAVSTSNSITVSGLGVLTAVSVTGGQYEKNGTGVWTSAAGTVFNTDTVKVRGTASGSVSTAVNVVLTIGTVSDTYTITTVASGGADTTPDAFSFTDATGVALSTLSTSNSITVSGIDTPSAISVTGGEYEKNGSGTWTTSAGTVVNGDTVKVRATSSASASTAINVVLTIGGVSDTYTITTAAAAGGFTFTPYAYYDETSFVDSGSGTASSWQDKGPNGIHLTQATSGARPTITSGKLVFDGTDDVLVSAAQNLSSKTALCAFISLKINAFGLPGDGDGVLVLGPTGGSDADANAALMFYPYDVDGMGAFRGAAFKVGAPSGLTQLHGVTFDLPSDTVTLYNHSASLSSAVTTLTNAAFGSALRFVLGSRWMSGAVASAFHAPIEVNRLLILDFVPNSTQLDEIWAWLAAPPAGAFTFTPLAYYDETSVVQTAGAVSQWTDKGPNGLHLVQATGARQPAWNAGLSFDGIDDSVESVPMDRSGTSTICCFARVGIASDAPARNNGIAILCGDNQADAIGSNGIVLLKDSTGLIAYRGGSSGSVALDNGEIASIGATLSGTELRVYNMTRGTTAGASTALGNFGGSVRMVLGRRGDASGGIEHFKGLIQRVVWTDFVPDSTQLDEIKAWLAGGGGAALWTPAALETDVVGWYDAQDTATITQTAGAISQWADKSTATDKIGNAVQANGAYQPTYNTTAFGTGKAGISFFGASNQRYLALGSLVGRSWTAAEVFYVMKRTADPPAAFNDGPLVNAPGVTSVATHEPFSGDGNLYSATFTTARKENINVVPSYVNPHVIGVRSAASDWQYWIDGTQIYTTATNVFGLPSASILGASEAQYFDGSGGEVVVVKRTLTTLERQRMEGYLAHRWGLQANLPVGHPYLTTPP